MEAQRKFRRKRISLQLRIDPELMDALRLFLKDADPAPTKTKAVESALRAFLRSRGYWPPPGQVA